MPFVIDDNVKVALRSGADGVHLGQADMGIQEARRILGEDIPFMDLNGNGGLLSKLSQIFHKN